MKTVLLSTLTLFLALPAANAQGIARNDSLSEEMVPLPSAPEPSCVKEWQSLSVNDRSGAKQSDHTPAQTKRILGVVPNFDSVSAGAVLPRQTMREKFAAGFQDSFDYSSFVFAGAQAGLNQATNASPAFRHGSAGFARYYWHTFADQTDENLLVETIIPIAPHEDGRFYTLGRGNFAKRLSYALSRPLILEKTAEKRPSMPAKS
jgi:hypothetical protein